MKNPQPSCKVCSPRSLETSRLCSFKSFRTKDIIFFGEARHTTDTGPFCLY